MRLPGGPGEISHDWLEHDRRPGTHPTLLLSYQQLQLCASISPALRVWAGDVRQGKSIVLMTLSNRVKDKLYQPWVGTQIGQSACVLRRKKPESGKGRRGWTMVGPHPAGCRFLGPHPRGLPHACQAPC